MKKLLLLLLLLPTLAFGQATGYVLPNFATSGSIGTAATTVDVYSRININQTTPSITLTVPNPTNTSTKVVEVWIGNKGTTSFTLIPGGVVDTSTAVILKWTGSEYYVIGTKTITDLTAYIRRDGTSAATTGDINIGNYNGLYWNGDFNVRTDGSSVSGGKYIKSYVGDGLYYSDVNILHNNIYSESNRKVGFSVVESSSMSIMPSSLAFQRDSGGTRFSTVSLNTKGVGVRSFAGGNSSYGSVYFRTDAINNTSEYVQQLQAKNGTIALTSDITGAGFLPSTLNSGRIFVGNGSNVAAGVDLTLSATPGTFALSNAGVLTMPNAATGTRGLLSSTDWNTFNNKIGLTSLSGTSGVSYDNTTGAISFNLSTGNTWTAQQTAPSLNVNGIGGNGFIQFANQSSAPTAVNGTLRMYSDNSNLFSLVRRNSANSTDITHSFSFPDASVTYTFPTPAGVSAGTVALLNRNQTFLNIQTFDANIIPLTNATRACGIANGNEWGSVATRAILTGQTLTMTAPNGYVMNTLNRSDGTFGGGLAFNGGNQSGTTNGTSPVTFRTGNVSNASNVQASGLVAIVTGDNAGSGASGNISLTTGSAVGARGNILLSSSNLNMTSTDLSVPHIKGSTAAPTVTAGSAAGTGATVSVTGNDIAGTITITTGTIVGTGGTVVTLNFNTTYTTAPIVQIDEGNFNAKVLSGVNSVYVDDASKSTTNAYLAVASGALANSTTYVFTYHIIQ